MMRRNDHEICDRSEMESIIRDATVCRLGCADDGVPYVVPLSFGFRSGAIYIHSAPEGEKIFILQKNPDCCIEFDECQKVVQAEKPCHWGMQYRSVICRGRAVFMTNPDEKRIGLNCIMNHYGGDSYTFSEKDLGNVSVIRIDILEMTGKKTA